MKKSIKIVSILLVSTMAFVASSCLKSFVEPTEISGKTIFELASAEDNFNILVAALSKTNLAGSLANNNSGSFTVFAPSDAAFLTYYKTLSAAYSGFTTEAEVINSINGLTAFSTPTISALAGVLNYHMVSSKITSDMITGRQTFTALNGSRLSLSNTSGGVVLNANATAAGITGANVTSVDNQASNGVIHTIDRVLTFSSGNASPIAVFGLSINYGVSPAVISGGSETGGDATGTDYDILAYALRISGLVSVLVPNITPLPDMTVFAPTDNAFRSYLGDNTAASAATENAAIQLIKAMPAAALSNLLNYHILTGRVLTTDLKDAQAEPTLLPGAAITVGISGTTYTLKDLNTGFTDPTISSANVFAQTGIVHQINGVLRPN